MCWRNRMRKGMSAAAFSFAFLPVIFPVFYQFRPVISLSNILFLNPVRQSAQLQTGRLGVDESRHDVLEDLPGIVLSSLSCGACLLSGALPVTEDVLLFVAL